MTTTEVARTAYIERERQFVQVHISRANLGGTYKGANVGTSPAYGCSAQIVEVAVDLEAGKAKLPFNSYRCKIF